MPGITQLPGAVDYLTQGLLAGSKLQAQQARSNQMNIQTQLLDKQLEFADANQQLREQLAQQDSLLKNAELDRLSFQNDLLDKFGSKSKELEMRRANLEIEMAQYNVDQTGEEGETLKEERGARIAKARSAAANAKVLGELEVEEAELKNQMNLIKSVTRPGLSWADALNHARVLAEQSGGKISENNIDQLAQQLYAASQMEDRKFEALDILNSQRAAAAGFTQAKTENMVDPLQLERMKILEDQLERADDSIESAEMFLYLEERRPDATPASIKKKEGAVAEARADKIELADELSKISKRPIKGIKTIDLGGGRSYVEVPEGTPPGQIPSGVYWRYPNDPPGQARPPR